MGESTTERVERACRELVKAGMPVTFPAVATGSGLGRATLYRNADLRAIVEEHRVRRHAASGLSSLREEVARLEASLEAVAAKVRRHDDQLRRLTNNSRRRSAGRD